MEKTIYCPRCGEITPTETSQCEHCFTLLTSCTGCGKPVLAASLYCIYCGEKTATLKNMEGQLGLEFTAGRSDVAMAILLDGKQAKVLAVDPMIDLKEVAQAKAPIASLKVELNGKEVKAKLNVQELFTKILEGDEVLNLSSQ